MLLLNENKETSLFGELYPILENGNTLNWKENNELWTGILVFMLQTIL